MTLPFHCGPDAHTTQVMPRPAWTARSTEFLIVLTFTEIRTTPSRWSCTARSMKPASTSGENCPSTAGPLSQPMAWSASTATSPIWVQIAAAAPQPMTAALPAPGWNASVPPTQFVGTFLNSASLSRAVACTSEEPPEFEPAAVLSAVDPLPQPAKRAVIATTAAATDVNFLPTLVLSLTSQLGRVVAHATSDAGYIMLHLDPLVLLTCDQAADPRPQCVLVPPRREASAGSAN